VLIVVTAGVFLLALLLGQLVSFDVLVVATRPLFDLLGGVLLVLLYIIVVPLAYVVEWIICLVLSLARADGNQPPPRPPAPAAFDNALQRFFAQQLSCLCLERLGKEGVIAIPRRLAPQRLQEEAGALHLPERLQAVLASGDSIAKRGRHAAKQAGLQQEELPRLGLR